MDCSPPGSSVHGDLQARILCGLPCPPPGALPNPGIEPRTPALQVDSLLSEPPGKPKNTKVGSLSLFQGSSLLKNWTGVFCIAGGFFTNWAVREALEKMIPKNLFAGQQWRNRHREQTYGHGERGGEGKLYGKSNLETYITICEIDSQWEFVVFCQTSTWISHRYTCIPSLLNLPPIFLPIPPPRLIKRGPVWVS